jgi:feruloyl esterase
VGRARRSRSAPTRLAAALLATLGLAASSTAAPAALPGEGGEAGACAALAGHAPADVRIVASTISNGADKAPARSAFCRVEGVIETEIGFELWLPLKPAWNGRFLAIGVGGQAGSIPLRELARGVDRGYATASTDTGHKASDPHWLLGDPMRAANYAHRANHLLADKGKALAAAFYGQGAQHAFFLGCSGGGRQALTEVQRYPGDYDGVIAGAPGVNTPQMSARRMWEMVQHSADAGLMSEADWRWVATSAVEACDADDGLKDGIVTNPARCRFTPRRLACGAKAGKCLSPAQLALVERIYAPLHDETGRGIDAGLLPGVAVSPALVPEPFTPGPPYLAVALFGDGVHRDRNWDGRTFRLASDLPAIDRVMDLHADDPQIAPFVRRGGKLILYQGWADPLVAPQPTLAYYAAVRKTLGPAGADRSVRLFMIPGMEHCRGGGVPDAFGGAGGDAPQVDPDHDMLSALERWTGGGPAPQRIVASQLKDGRVVRTRPLCARPAEARYRGGDPEQASSFACAVPTPKRSPS